MCGGGGCERTLDLLTEGRVLKPFISLYFLIKVQLKVCRQKSSYFKPAIVSRGCAKRCINHTPVNVHESRARGGWSRLQVFTPGHACVQTFDWHWHLMNLRYAARVFFLQDVATGC